MSESETELTPLSKWGLRIIGAGILAVLVLVGFKKGIIPTPGFSQPTVIESNTQLAENNDPVSASIAANTAKLPLPSMRPANVSGPEIRFEQWFWIAQLGCNLANGGITPMEGSLMAKHGVNLKMVWNDITPKMRENFIAFAAAHAGGNSQPTEGAHFYAVMGDQAAQEIGPINEQLKKYGPDYQAEIVYSCGRSNGEDALMGPASWKSNPRNALGGLVSVAPKEGDWNIVVKWARDNNLPINPDDQTWSADAVNFYSPADYMDAAEKYITNTCEDRRVVKGGILTKETKNVCINAVSTWTPADVNIAEKRGGLVRIVSTKEYSGQMPNVVIGLKKWNQENRQLVVNMIRAFGEAGDQALAYEDALKRAAEASATVWGNSQSADWIMKYYKGVQEKDVTGTIVDLGGSRVHNLADNMRWFGLNPGSANKFAATYTVFGNIIHELYPKLLPRVPPVSEVLNTSYLEEAAKLSKVTVAETSTFAGGNISDVTSNQEVHIEFQTGSAVLTPRAEVQLRDLLDNLVVAGDLAIEISGHTDNVGTPDKNQALSEARAFAVKRWLQAQAPNDFMERRFSRVVGYGQDKPLEPNSTPAGRSHNRRVEIVLGRQ